MSKGYYRGNISALVRDAMLAFNALSPEEQAKHREIQKESYVRGELGIGNDAKEAADREAFRQTMLTETLTSREIALSKGFTGNSCSNCGSIHMKISGHCEVCTDCGTTTGCS